MAQPSFLSEGVMPRLTDTRWSILVKWLGTLQNQAGAIALNNPRRDDTRRILLGKINSALAGVTFPADSCCDGGQIASYDCVGDVCVDPGDGTGEFGSLAECEAADCGGISPTSFNCVDGSCVDPGDGTGTYASLEECEIACGVTPSWNCVDNVCVDPGDGSGTYATLDECEAVCVVPVSYNCVDGTCVDPGDGTGAYATLGECEAECTPPITDNTISYAFWMEMLSQPDLAGADIISGYDFDLWDDPSGSRQSRIRLRCVAVGGGADTYTFQVTITQGVASNTGTSSAVAMPVRTWHHVAVIYDGDTGFASIYVDTVLVGASSGTPVILTTQPFGLFNATNATQTPAALLDAYACLQDMTGVWVGHALDGAELAVLYGGGTGFNGPPWTGLTTPTAWWDFDDAGRIDATENFVDTIAAIELDPGGSIAQLEGLLGGFSVIKTGLMRIVETEVIADFAYTA